MSITAATYPHLFPELQLIPGLAEYPNVRRPGIVVDYTTDQVAEIIKCIQDKHYFIENYCKIYNVDHGLIPFKPYEYQNKIMDTVTHNRYTIVKLPRQAGKTTTIAAIVAWYITFTPKFKVALLAQKVDQAMEILARVKEMLENLPKWMQQGAILWNRKSLELENGASVITAATTGGSIRGQAINLVYLDEFAIIPPNIQDSFYTGVFPTITSGTTTKVVITSTPKGFNLFYKLWTDAENGKNDFKPIDIHWSETPGRDQAWAEEMIRNIGQLQFNQEFNTDFLGSSDTLISATKLKSIVYVDPVQADENLKIFERPEPGHAYVLAADCSDGVDRDYHSFAVIDVTTIPYRVVATYRNNTMERIMYPDVLYRMGMWYNEAFLIVENNNMGGEVANALFYDLEYENLFTTTKEIAGNAIIEGGSRTSVGINTNAKTKRIGCANLKTLVENDQLLTQDWQILQELARFIKYKKSYRAEEGEHDDLVMCLVIFAYLTSQPIFKSLTNTDLRGELLARKNAEIEQSLLPFGIIADGSEEDSLIIDLVRDDFDNFMLS